MAFVEARPLESPSLVGVVEVRLSIMTDRVAILVDDNGGVKILGGCRPPMCDVYLFRIPYHQFGIILESGCSSPDRSDAGASRFEEWRDVAQRLKVVA